jgi:hypothetical protein
MRKGYLSEYFAGVAVKVLSAVEADPVKSNQHEFHGTKSLKLVLGASKERQQFSAKFIYLNDHNEETLTADGFLTWYDSRSNNPERSAEYRLYFPTTPVSLCAAKGDLLVIGKKQDGSFLVIIAEAESTIAN